MEIKVLGTVVADVGGTAVNLGPRQQRLVFAVLALEANRLVPVERLVELVWPIAAPRTAEHAIRVCASRLRSGLAAAGADPSDIAVTGSGPGYVLAADPLRIDAHLFRDLLDRARATADDTAAVALLDRALGLWRGPALADAAQDDVRDRLCAGLEESRLVAMEDRFDALLRLGGHRDVAAELVALARARPDRERLVGQLMVALHRCGQTGQALDAYRRTRAHLRQELGIEPGAALRSLEVGILRDDPAVRAPAEPVPRSVGAASMAAAGSAASPNSSTGSITTTGASPTTTAVPATTNSHDAAANEGSATASPDPAGQASAIASATQASAIDLGGVATTVPSADRHRSFPVPALLPASVSDFTGRTAHLRWLDGMVPDPAASAFQATAMPIAVIAGTAGVGKTALAVRWAHGVRDRFPDGQLYVDMRGYTPGGPVRPQQALSQFLRAVGVPAEQVPVDAVEAAGMFRTLLADRRMLVLLDNVHAAEQVRPLLPASPGCLVVVTSRDRLDGLVARDSARRATLDVLTEQEALALLGRMAGQARVAAEPEAAAGLVRTCARLPLALRITAAHLAARPGLRLAEHLADLGRGDLLAQLEIDGDTETAVGAAFDFSYGALKPDARRLFRLVGLVPGVDVTAPAAAALAGLPRAEAARLLDRLAAVHLVDQHRPGRYAMHDLLRRYAAQQAHEEEAARERAAAAERLVEHYLGAVTAAADLLYPYMLRLPELSSGVEVTGTTEPSGSSLFADHAAALAWLDDERLNLLAVVHDASGSVPQQAAWLLADGLRGYFYLRRYYAEWIEMAERALAVAQAQGRPQACAAAHFSLGTAYFSRNQYPKAVEHYELAAELSRETGWLLGEAAVLINLGLIDEDLGDLARSAERCRAALALTRRAGSRHNEATALVNLGAVCELLGRLDEAAGLQGRALEINRELGSRRGAADALYYLASIAALRGRPIEALADCTQALAVYREIGARNDEALSLAMLAVLLGNAGRSQEALEAARSAVGLAEETGEQRTEAAVHIALAGIWRDLGNTKDAAVHDEHALHVAAQIGARFEQCQALLGLAGAGADTDAPDSGSGRARRRADEALRLARDRGYRLLEGRALVALAELGRAEGNSGDAQKLAESGLAIHRETGYRRGQAEALRVLGSVRQQLSGTHAARPAWQEAHALLAEIGSPDAAGVEELLARSA